jgi:Lrp/AsnC family transcriptional regulator, regulator for asnA, asnC and gidA
VVPVAMKTVFDNASNGIELTASERAIVAMLQDDGRAAYVDIARAVDLDESSVRRTVRRLVDAGVMAITSVANPRLLGLEAMGWIGLEVDWKSVDDLPGRMLAIQGVDYVVTCTGRFQIMAEIAAHDLPELDERIAAIRRLPGVRSSETFVYLDLPHQEYRWSRVPRRDRARDGHGVPLTDLDRQLIVVLRRSGRQPFRQIAGELRVPEHRVRESYHRLTRHGVMRVMAVLNPRRLGLNAMAWLGVRVRPEADPHEVAGAVAGVAEVDYVVICTGRYDLLAEVACADAEQLTRVVGAELGAIEPIREIEVFGYLRLEYRDESVWSAGRASALGESS